MSSATFLLKDGGTMAPKSGPGAKSRSDFETMFAASAVPALMIHQARGIVYRPAATPSGAPAAVDLSAMVGSEEAREIVREDGGTVVERVRVVTFSRDPHGTYGGVARPAIHDQVEIDADVYEVRSVSNQNADLVNVECWRLPASEKSRDDYRRRI